MMKINRRYAEVVRLLIVNIWQKPNQDFALSALSILVND